MDISQAILTVTKSVTKKWTKQRKAEDRNASAQARRYDALLRRNCLSVK